MIKLNVFLLTLLFFISLDKTSKAQSYTIQSFEGVKTKIKLSENATNGRLVIYCLRDSLTLAYYNYTKDVRILENKFLQITYGVKAGVDINASNILLLCVSNGKLCQPMHINSFIKYSFKAVDKEIDTLLFDEHYFCQLKLHLTGTNKNNYKFNINIHNEEKSKEHPNINHNTYSKTVLSYGVNKHIFYSAHQLISRNFKLFDSKTQTYIKKHFIGNFPVIKIGSSTYYYIKNEWYTKNVDDRLAKYAY